ncbi:fumarylacetoacetase [Cyphellophora europaea CBS 101466]|uniref:Fumarylacetoacetase n=1 Tax=Cyphellophora europaea (strain CBS 101466) TaxID=1220924 RepID=W2RT28_CYPE1|nr:fumarylacetoacetase [Cyphellophora europaea CBS 101466]ETN38878.1 fumarylacetoacetase [Cyphellophora europaea CBS 101466]
MTSPATTRPGWDDAHFTPSNIPYGIASTSSHPGARPVTRLYNNVYFLSDLISHNLIGPFPPDTASTLTNESTLNAFAALSTSTHQEVRSALQKLFLDSPQQQAPEQLQPFAHPLQSVTLHLPFQTGDFTDFSCSHDHVLNAGEAATGTRALPPAFPYYPIGYSGRTSSIVPSGTPITRPYGAIRASSTTTTGATAPSVVFVPSRAVDFELEVAAVISRPTSLGDRVSLADAEAHIFGLLLLNDWSARDIQTLEMPPLGPLNGKSFGTTLSPWVVPMQALEPFRCSGAARREEGKGAGGGGVEQPVAYLRSEVGAEALGPHFRIDLQVDLFPGFHEQARQGLGEAVEGVTVCRSRLDTLAYGFRDLVVHQTVNGCALRTGDLLATGTVSGSEEGSLGCLMEMTKGGKQTLKLGNGEQRVYLEDGDGVRLTGWAGELGTVECVGFGEAWGVLLPARE